MTGIDTGDPGERPVIVPQRAVLVLPTTAEFDSRTYRIASSLTARGHDVTVLARQGEGLPIEEHHPAGYRIVRVPATVADGLPAWIRRLVVPRRARPEAAAAAPADAASAKRQERPRAAAARWRPDWIARSAGRRLVRLLRRAAGGAIRRLAIPLVIRAQRRATHRIAPPADILHGMAYMGIPVALDLARRDGAKVVYDARDIYVDAANLARLPAPIRRAVGIAERRWARRADRVLTVNRPYAEVMASRWRIDLPLIVMNCAYRTQPPDPPERRFHTSLGLPDDRRVVLYQGGFSRDRGIEQLIVAIDRVENSTLVLMGYGPMEAELRAIADKDGHASRIAVVKAVPPTELLAWVASADVVAMPIQPTTLNHRLTTPNKLFEAMAVGVPVVASDLPGMADIVRETGCGLLVDPTDPERIAGAIRAILDAPAAERADYRARSLAAAHDVYNWERQFEVLVAEYGRLTRQPW